MSDSLLGGGGNGGVLVSPAEAEDLNSLLAEAGLSHHSVQIRDALHVYNVGQLKYVEASDFYKLGMTKPEVRRLKNSYNKHKDWNKHSKYTAKIRNFLQLPSSSGAHKDECLINKDDSPEAQDTGAGDNSFFENQQQISDYEAFYLSKKSEKVRVSRQHIISAESVEIYKTIGQGEFGVVQQGVLTDVNHGTHQVAVKCLSKERFGHGLREDEFMKEFNIMQSMDHVNIVRLFGAVLNASDIMLITELAPLRSLLECLKEPSMRSSLTVPHLSDYAKQIASGMEYLERKRLIHRDLAARNILVFSKSLVKVSDFGLSRALGVGKDYYQTNFSVNLKLPIAWCAPECITFLKFTSASDVWAFGVTMWEMFSYGFQPWAAHTGQQILEAIDQPNCQRLEQPLHCPAEYYLIMDNAWMHDPSRRPNFTQLKVLLDNAKPLIYDVVKPTKPKDETRGRLKLEAGQSVTLLDRFYDKQAQGMWKGCVNETGKVGLFHPSHTTLQHEGGGTRKPSFSSASSSAGRVIYEGIEKFVKVNISKPTLNNQAAAPVSNPETPTGTDSSVNSPTGVLDSRLGNVDISESAPLISSSRSGHFTSKGGGGQQAIGLSSGHYLSVGERRMGTTIGYLRNKTSSSQRQSASTGEGGGGLTPSGGSGGGTATLTKHEYQSICDEEDEQEESTLRRPPVVASVTSPASSEHDELFLSPLDFGPSLSESVFSELNDSTAQRAAAGSTGAPGATTGAIPKNIHSVKAAVSASLYRAGTRMRSRQKSANVASVKPIKASDEKTLESAIAMAHSLASKSMHDLDKRCRGEIFDPVSPNRRSPSLTPGSPTKRFFWFPSVRGAASTSSPKGGALAADGTRRQPFLDDTLGSGATVSIENMLSDGSKSAYEALIDNGPRNICSTSSSKATASHSNPSSPRSPPANLDQQVLLPALPPKSDTVKMTVEKKRHVRKNPLVMHQSEGPPQQPSSNCNSKTKDAAGFRSKKTPGLTVQVPAHGQDLRGFKNRQPSLHAAVDSGGGLSTRGHYESFDDEIAKSMNALDNIQ